MNSPEKYRILEVENTNVLAGLNTFIESHKDVTIYHTSQWRKVVEETFGYKGKTIVAIDENETIVGCLPIWRVHRGYSNSPWRDRAQILYSDKEVGRQIINYLLISDYDFILKDYPDRYVPDQLSRVDYWITHRMDISDNIEKLWKPINKTVGRNIRKAKKYGFCLSEEVSEKSMRDFYKVFILTRKRLGVPIYPFAFFHNILKWLDGKGLSMHLAYHKSTVAGGIIVFSFGKNSIYAFGGSNEKYLSARVNDLLIWDAIKCAKERNVDYFDFGADSPNQQSLMQFKKKWGAYPMVLPTLLRKGKENLFFKLDFSSDAYQLQRKILSNLPISILILLGRLATKYGG